MTFRFATYANRAGGVARMPDEVLPPAPRTLRRAGGPEDDERVRAGQFLLGALADARDELARRLALVNAGVGTLAVLSPAFGLITLVSGSAGFADVERVIQSVDQVLGTTGPRLLERIGNGEATRLESLRTLVGNVTTTIEQTVPDVSFLDSPPVRFLREVVAESFVDLGNFVRELPDKLPAVGVGLGAFLLGLAALLFATR